MRPERLRQLVSLLVLVTVSSLAFAQAVPPGASRTLDRIKSAKEIRVAFSGDSPPFSSVAANGEPAGFAIDLCRRVIAEIGRAVGEPELRTRWLVGTVAERIDMVATGKADLDCANTTTTLTRRREVDFSALVFVDTGGLLVKEGSPVERVAGLEGKRLGVLAGTTTEARIQALLKRQGINASVVRLADGVEGVAMLESGSLDAFAADKLKLAGLTAEARAPRSMRVLPDDLSYEPQAFAVPRNDSSFRLEVDRALSQVYGSGEIERIFAHWLGRLGKPAGLSAAVYLLNVIPE
jgi:polar amino acid transport system substrate-binding protein/glutamate/aspartate transport system substrate-binding protein